MKPLWLLLGALTVTYPLLVYWGLQKFEPRYLGLSVIIVYFLRLVIVSRKMKARVMAFCAAIAIAAVVWLLNSETLLVLFPVVMSAVMFIVFLHSIIQPPTLPARMAMKVHGELSEHVIRYTNGVTWFWLGFFLINGSIACYTAFFASREIWTLYNGLLSYIFMGVLFGGELLYRNLVFKRKYGES